MPGGEVQRFRSSPGTLAHGLREGGHPCILQRIVDAGQLPAWITLGHLTPMHTGGEVTVRVEGPADAWTYDFRRAWLCWQRARSIASTHPVLEAVAAYERKLEADHPEYFRIGYTPVR